jgi:His-Xaa-Ser system radical SAM maturase HxsC
MKLHTKGVAVNIVDPIVGSVTRDIDNCDESSILVLENEGLILENTKGKKAFLLQDKKIIPGVNSQYVYAIPDLSHLQDGDLISIDRKGNINTLYRVISDFNTLLVTERCNNNCLMCSQPPKLRNDIESLFEIHKQLLPLIPKTCCELALTGGEPTLLGNLFFELLRLIKFELPETEIHILTNGRAFAWKENAERLAELKHNRLMLGIPLYSDYYADHDYIVQTKNAFDQTILGMHNLANNNQRIELRVVLNKLTIPRLVKLSKYIFKNLPFVEHIAFMGLENVGLTMRNWNEIWIDPMDYMKELEEAVCFLEIFGFNVSIYNLQLCLLPRSLWKFATKSISDWKNNYLVECESCSMKNHCGGFFSSNLRNQSNFIKPIDFISE